MSSFTHPKDNDDAKCASLEKCQHTKHILDTLLYYQSFQGDNDNLVEYCTNQCSLVDDYNHLIVHHDIESVDQWIHKVDEYKALACSFSSCVMYKRSNRSRESVNTDDTTSFWRDLLDQIHCFILHSFDCGLRIKTPSKSTKNDNDASDEKKSNDTDLTDVDLLSIAQATGNAQIENHRFVSKKFDLNMNIHSKDAHFNVGYTFYYWQYFKENKASNQQYWFNQNDRMGYDTSQLYIEPKYGSLKEELFDNGIQAIKPSLYAQILQKAKIYIVSNMAKAIKAGDEEDDLHYGIKEGSALTIQHLMSIVLYTDLSTLSRSFSSTFRLLHPSEILSSIKNRNREYWHWSKLIRETVECYGDLMGFENRTPFYCGTDYMLISSYLIRLCSPSSTSKQLSVACKFAANDGIILQINGGSNCYAANVRYFNCSWISCYNDEDERLFCGGAWPIRVESVRLIKDKQNLQQFFKALFYFDCMVCGVAITSQAADEVSKMDKRIIQALIQQRLSIKENTFLKYVNDSFSAFCGHKRQIIINQRQIAERLSLFKDILFVAEDVNMIQLNSICLLFPQCTRVIIYDDENGYAFDVVTFLSDCETCIESTDNKLEQIAVRIWRGDDDEDSWFRTAYGDDIASHCGVNIAKQTERNEESWDIVTITCTNINK